MKYKKKTNSFYQFIQERGYAVDKNAPFRNKAKFQFLKTRKGFFLSNIKKRIYSSSLLWNFNLRSPRKKKKKKKKNIFSSSTYVKVPKYKKSPERTDIILQYKSQNEPILYYYQRSATTKQALY